jgi:hypothetical protein
MKNSYLSIINKSAFYLGLMVVLKLFSRFITPLILFWIPRMQPGGLQLQNNIIFIVTYFENFTTLSLIIHSWLIIQFFLLGVNFISFWQYSLDYWIPLYGFLLIKWLQQTKILHFDFQLTLFNIIKYFCFTSIPILFFLVCHLITSYFFMPIKYTWFLINLWTLSVNFFWLTGTNWLVLSRIKSLFLINNNY